MKTISRTTFTTVKAKGGILPADLLQRIAEGRNLEGLRPEDDYHLFPGERLNEAVNQAWRQGDRIVGGGLRDVVIHRRTPGGPMTPVRTGRTVAGRRARCQHRPAAGQRLFAAGGGGLRATARAAERGSRGTRQGVAGRSPPGAHGCPRQRCALRRAATPPAGCVRSVCTTTTSQWSC